jgi:hypothetical protein
MPVLDPVISYLLDHKELGAAAAVSVVALLVFGGMALWRHVAGNRSNPGRTAISTARGQTTQVSDVRAKGDVVVSPEQRNG